MNVSLQCSLPLDALDAEDAANLIKEAEAKEEDAEAGSDSDDSVILSSPSKMDIVEESPILTPRKKRRIAIG